MIAEEISRSVHALPITSVIVVSATGDSILTFIIILLIILTWPYCHLGENISIIIVLFLQQTFPVEISQVKGVKLWKLSYLLLHPNCIYPGAICIYQESVNNISVPLSTLQTWKLRYPFVACVSSLQRAVANLLPHLATGYELEANVPNKRRCSKTSDVTQDYFFSKI